MPNPVLLATESHLIARLVGAGSSLSSPGSLPDLFYCSGRQLCLLLEEELCILLVV